MRRKILLISMFFFLLVGVGAVLLLSRQAKPPVLISRTDPPKISFEQRHHDLGTVSEGTEIPSVYRFHNVGGETLVIKNATSSCGCATVNLRDKAIDPGKVGELEVVIDTTQKQGYLNKEIDVYSNDPKHPESKIYLSANVIPMVLPQKQPLDSKPSVTNSTPQTSDDNFDEIDNFDSDLPDNSQKPANSTP